MEKPELTSSGLRTESVTRAWRQDGWLCPKPHDFFSCGKLSLSLEKILLDTDTTTNNPVAWQLPSWVKGSRRCFSQEDAQMAKAGRRRRSAASMPARVASGRPASPMWGWEKPHCTLRVRMGGGRWQWCSKGLHMAPTPQGGELSKREGRDSCCVGASSHLGTVPVCEHAGGASGSPRRL